MKQIFQKVVKELQDGVPELKFIDWDYGQLSVVAERPAIDYPACLIDINYPMCRDMDDFTQLITANIVLKLIFKPTGETNSLAPAKIRERALKCFDIIEKIQNCLQGNTLDDTVSAISRASLIKTVRNDRLQVYTVTYNTTFQEVLE